MACLATLGGLLLGLPALRDATGSQAVTLVEAMVRSGSFVFGGGHVVLPLLDQALVEPGWVSEQEFLAGYGLAQAMPGPLFSFSAYLGALEEPAPNGVAGAALALVAIYLPSFLLLGGVLPFWSSIRRHVRVQAALVGVSAAVVGVLAAALWDPILTGSIDTVGDAAFAAGLLVLLGSCLSGRSSRWPPRPGRSSSSGLRWAIAVGRRAAAAGAPFPRHAPPSSHRAAGRSVRRARYRRATP